MRSVERKRRYLLTEIATVGLDFEAYDLFIFVTFLTGTVALRI
jgi:hypothetical protein